jgi:hypothetical protein
VILTAVAGPKDGGGIILKCDLEAQSGSGSGGASVLHTTISGATTATYLARNHPGLQMLTRYLLLGLLVLMVSNPARSQRPVRPEPCAAPNPNINLNLPTLNVVQTAVLSPSYSCRSAADFAKGYASTAVFLSGYSKDENAPELLFNGACGAADYFDVNTAGDEMSLIGDLGNTPLTSVTTDSAFNLKNVAAFAEGVGHEST